MSFDGQTWAWKQVCPSPNARLVLLYLAMRADDDTGYCYPGQKTIAKETGLSERTVRDVLSALTAANLIIRKPRYSDRFRTSDDIWVLFSELTIFAGRAANPAGSTDFPPDLPADRAPAHRQIRSRSPAPAAGQNKSGNHSDNQSEESSLRSDSVAGKPSDDPDLAADSYGDDSEPPPPVASPPLPARGNPVRDAFDAYNAKAEEVGWPVARDLNDERRKKLKARLRAAGVDGWRDALDRAAQGPHLCGENDRGWRANLDFFLQPSSFQKVIEGYYDRTGGSNGSRVGADRRGGGKAGDLRALHDAFMETGDEDGGAR